MIKMKFLRASKFHALYSPVAGMWKIKLDDVEFEIRHVLIAGCKENLRQNFQDITAEDVDVILISHCLIITSWTKLKKKAIWSNLYDPDMPKGLAKTVTVK